MEEAIADESLPYEITNPSWVDLSDICIDITWAYGSQGHPASMRIMLIAFQENNNELRLWRHGPIRSGGYDESYLDIPFDQKILKKWILFGQEINKRWGNKWDWWRCAEGCTGWVAGTEFHERCVDCDEVRNRELIATKEWLEQCKKDGMI